MAYLLGIYVCTDKVILWKAICFFKQIQAMSWTLLFPVIVIWWQCIKCWTFPYFSCLWELSPDSSERAERVLLAVGVEASHSSFCLAISCTRCSREKCVPRARRRYSWAFLRSSITSANQLDNAGSFVVSSGWRMKFTQMGNQSSSQITEHVKKNLYHFSEFHLAAAVVCFYSHGSAYLVMTL